jgi:hypothetical protein
MVSKKGNVAENEGNNVENDALHNLFVFLKRCEKEVGSGESTDRIEQKGIKTLLIEGVYIVYNLVQT